MNRKLITLITALILIFSLFPACAISADEPVKIGDYLQMGTYYGAPILWRCVDIDEKGPLMMTDGIICLKPFDAQGENKKGSHGRGHFSDEMNCLNRIEEGSNCWRDSNIRCWLNSAAEAGEVIWSCGNAPTADKVALNEYDNEAGFMTNFTAKELDAVKWVTQKQLLDCYENCTDGSNTPAREYHGFNSDIKKVLQNYDFALSEQVADRFFLPDVKQVYAVYNNSSILGEGYYIGAPTDECVENSKCTEEISSSEKWCFWLRTPRANPNGTSTNVRLVRAEGGVYASFADQGYYGVRPAFYLNDSVAFESGEGTKENPYNGIINTGNRISDCYINGSIIRVNAEVDNIESGKKLMFAAFNKQNKLIHFEIAETVDTLNTYDFAYAGDSTYKEHKYKIFIWDGEMHPLGAVISANASDF